MIMTKNELIQKLRAALSWELAEYAINPALQAILEIDRQKSNGNQINTLGVYGKYKELFEVITDD